MSGRSSLLLCSAAAFLFGSLFAELLIAQDPGQGGSGGSGYVQVGPDRLFYETAGEGPAIIFIHDGLVHRELWDAQYSFFSGDYRVIRYDRRGFGNSPPATVPYSNVEDLDRLLTALGIEQACLVAASAGGRAAIDFTIEHPERVRALVLVGAVVRGLSYTRHFNERGGRMPQFDASDIDIMRDRMRAWFAAEDPWTVLPENTAAKRRVMELVAKNPRRGLSPDTETPAPERPALQRLGEIRVPTLILTGEYDIPDVHAHAGAINAGIPGSLRDIIPGAAHLVPIEQPGRLNRVVADFLFTRSR